MESKRVFYVAHLSSFTTTQDGHQPNSTGLYTHCKGSYGQRDGHSHFCPQQFFFKKMTPTPVWVITWLIRPALVATHVGYVGFWLESDVELTQPKTEVKRLMTDPEGLCCPISQQLMEDPVVAGDGFTYERSTVEALFKYNGNSPLTRQPFENHVPCLLSWRWWMGHGWGLDDVLRSVWSGVSQKIRLIVWSRTWCRNQPWKWCSWSAMFTWPAQTRIALQKQSEGYTWIFCILHLRSEIVPGCLGYKGDSISLCRDPTSIYSGIG